MSGSKLDCDVGTEFDVLCVLVLEWLLALLLADGDKGIVDVGDARIGDSDTGDLFASDFVGSIDRSISSSSGISFEWPLMCASISFLFLNVSSQIVHL